MEDHAKLPVTAKATRRTYLNHGTLQQTALWEHEAVSVKERLRNHGFDFVTLTRRPGTESRQ